MKNKSEKKKTAQNVNNLPWGWFLMGRKEYTVLDLKAALDEKKYDIEIWNEAGILEIGIDEKNSMDIEEGETDFGDEYSNAFVAEHEIKSVFYLSFCPEIYEECKKIMQRFVECLDCVICADTEDFMPQITR
ncbi:MAG: hypothetical protein ACI4F0_02800 [Agathobacter sp.]